MDQCQSLKLGNMQTSISDTLQSTRRALSSSNDHGGGDLLLNEFPFSPISEAGSPCEISAQSSRSPSDCSNDVSMDSCSYSKVNRNLSERNRSFLGSHPLQIMNSNALGPYSRQSSAPMQTMTPHNNSVSRRASLPIQHSSPCMDYAAVTSGSCKMQKTMDVDPQSGLTGGIVHQQTYGTPRNQFQDPGLLAPKSELLQVIYAGQRGRRGEYITALKQNQPYSIMSIWAKTQHLGQDALQQVQSTYSLNNFPLEVRHHFASWIEQQPWKDIDESNPTHETYAVQLLDALVVLIDEKAAEETTDFISRFKFNDFSTKFKEFYSSNPMNLVRVVKTCLGKEEMLIQMAENPTKTVDTRQSNKTKDTINKDIQDLKKMTDVTEEEVRQMQHKQEQFIIHYQKSLQINSQLLQLPARNQAEIERKLKQQKDELEKQLLASAQELLTLRLDLSCKHNETINKLDVLQKKVVDGELITWKRQQQLSGNGAASDAGHLETIQSWCESLAEIIWNNRKQWFKEDILRQQLPIEAPQGTNDYHHELNPKITGLLSSLVTSTFIVETQPPQVLKKDSRFTATVRLLVGRQLNIYMTPPQVKATIISEAQARALLKNESKAKEENSGEIINHSGTMEYNQASGHLSVTFRNMQLKKIKRADRKGTETVAEEKFCILFQSNFTVGGHELVFQVWTLSLPVVVTVHGNQECNAMATVLWDNQFSEPGRTPFQVPDSVHWPDLAEMLNTKFTSMTGRPLSLENISYLAQKLFGGTHTEDHSKTTIMWSQFNKESLPTRNFTFWEWFYAIMKLTREHLRNQWSDGLILGFVSKQQSQDQLLTKPNGTFLLRYSDSELGGITIAWVTDNPDGERQVWNLAPFTSKDFSIRSLADRIKDLNTLLYLYPDIPKAKAFSKYYTLVSEEQPTKAGYIKSALMSVIPYPPNPQNASVMCLENPQTPQPYNGPTSPPTSLLSHQDSVHTEQSMESDFDEGSLYGIATDYGTDDLGDDIMGQININDLLALSKGTQ